MKRKDILILLIPTCIIIFCWVIFNIYHNYITSTIPATLGAQIQSITPNFDMNAINNIKGREAITPLYDLGAIPQESGTTNSESIPISTSSANLSTQGGALLQ